MSVSTDIDEKRFVVFEYTINHLTSGYVVYPGLDNIFLFVFFLLFFTLPSRSTFKPLNVQTSKFEQL